MNKLKRRGLANLSCDLPSAFVPFGAHKRGPNARIMRISRLTRFTWLVAFWMIFCPVPSAQAEVEVEAPIIVALGDSLTAGYGLAPADGFVPQMQAALRAKGHQVELKNAGVSGDTSSGGLARLDWAVGPAAKGVILALGANDMLRGIAPALTRQNLDTIITRLQARNIDIMLVGMLAAPNLGDEYARAFNSIYPQLAQKYGLVFYPFFLEGVAAQRHLNLPDGIHPNRDGIAQIVARISPQVERFIQPLKTKQ